MIDARIDLLFTMSDNTRPPGKRSLKTDAKLFLLTDDDMANPRANARMFRLVEPDGIEPTTSCLQSRRSPS